MLRPRSTVHAVTLWLGFVVVFILAGGLGAGVMTLIFESAFDESITDELYAIVFGVAGFIAYRLAAGVAANSGSVPVQ
ncbi:MAG: hypothetical protein AAF752_03910 [Bacteroidota bacterium]